ncbi:hypothetical protein J6590_090548, partial [Homalodisca vitripennis]
MKPRLRLGLTSNEDSDDSGMDKRVFTPKHTSSYDDVEKNLTLKALLDERTNTISYASDEYTSYAPRDPPTPRLQPGHQRTSVARLFRPCSSTPRWEEQRLRKSTISKSRSLVATSGSEKTLWRMMIYDLPRGLEPNEPGMFSKEYQVNGDGVKNLRGRHRVKVCGYLYQSRRLAKT